ncbi:MAG TPA: alpha/beta hydrolase [Rhizomicrobium sp.]|nr:alpha/beta hydrolase [Rhizomicrobium sp.]
MSAAKPLVATGLAALRRGGVALLNSLVPCSGYAVQRDFAFGADPRHRLDLYVPEGLTRPAPMLLFFYGGGWQGGNRATYRAFGQAFASAGIVTAVADYRLYPAVTYPAFVEDAAAALAFLQACASDHGGDPRRIFVSGHSAGAYNAVMLASEPKFLQARGGSLDWIRGVIGIAGPYDFLPMEEEAYVAMFHGRNNLDSMPVNHVDGPRPPMLLITGDRDRTVHPRNTISMAAKLRSLGSPVTEIHYRGIGHVRVILSLLPGFRWMSPLRRDMLNFIHSR